VSGAGPGAAAGDASAAPLRLSTATVEQLDELDGIGPALAERIVEFRTRNGGIRSVEELAEVEGIGDARLATLREVAVP
jgi:competence protein ComEA